jgi:RNA polymerase sigma factor (sigma-70 family)
MSYAKKSNQRPCRNCGRLFFTNDSSTSVCSFACKPKVYFQGDPVGLAGSLTTEERNNLVRQWTGLAWLLAVKAHRSWLIAQRFLDVEDLYQEGVIGLIKSAATFETGHGATFKTYAFRVVHNAVNEAIKRSPIIHVPSQYFTEKTDEHDTEWQKRLKEAKRALGITSTSHEAEDEFDTAAPNETGGFDNDHMPIILKSFGHLHGRSVDLLNQRFGLNGQTPQSLASIGKALGISKERARQVEAKALKKVREYLTDTPEDGLQYRPAKEVALHRLRLLQSRMNRLWDELTSKGDEADWTTFNWMERQEQELRNKLGLNRAS